MHKIEIDVLKQAQLQQAVEFTRRYKCPAIIVSPDLVTSATINRSMARGNFKIIAAVDWPKGTQYLSDKFRGMASEAVNADGFEILLTPSSKIGITKEVKFLSQFFKDHFPPTVELRLVLGWYAGDRTKEQYEYMLEACKQIPSPTIIRSTHLTKLSSMDGSTDSHNAIIDAILKIKSVPIKISGNISMKSRLGCKKATKFACTLEQAITLQKSLAGDVIGKVNAAVHDVEEENSTHATEEDDS